MKHMDYIYLTEDYYKNKKETFTFLIDLIKTNAPDNYSLLDIGCARGELLYHIKNDIPNFSYLHGIDYSSDLIESAKKLDLVNDVKFSVGDAEHIKLKENFDLIVCSGLTGYFDSLDGLFSGIRSCLKDNGVAYVFHLFNELDVDVIIKYRNNEYFDEFEPGWNNHSIKSAKKSLKKSGLKLLKTHKFKLSFDDVPKEDPARSWTVIADNEKKFVNGLGMIYDLICLEIRQ